MSGSSFGSIFRLSSYGESHGSAIGGTLEGCPAGLKLDIAAIQKDLDRRRPGQSKHTTQRNEPDSIEILSGVFEGVTTGTPIGLYIANTNQKSKDYSDIATLYRPGHADYTYQHKYGIRDYRGGGRSSARETAVRVAAGAIGKQILASVGITINACVSAIGSVTTINNKRSNWHEIDWQTVNSNDFFCPTPELLPELESLIQKMRKDGDSIGAEITLVITGAPPGLGEPVFDRIDADLAKAMMSINAVKAVSIGDGFDVVNQKGSEHRDEITPEGFTSNHAGGILGGITSGQPIIAKVAFKPTSSITTIGNSVDQDNNAVQIVTKGRHDPCVGIRAVAIVEAMASLVITDHWLRDRASRL